MIATAQYAEGPYLLAHASADSPPAPEPRDARSLASGPRARLLLQD
jgi:hypothetical protein